MPDLSFTEVAEILRLLQQVDGTEVVVEWGDVSVQVQRGAQQDGKPRGEMGAATGASGNGYASRTPAEVETPTQSSSVEAGALRGEDDESGADLPAHWIVVSAPMVGTFYRAPKPSEPPFVEIGDTVAAGDKVGLVEVMKLFTELTCDVAGKVAHIGADDGDLVEYGQPLLWIEPS